MSSFTSYLPPFPSLVAQRVWNLISGEERYPPLTQCGSNTVAYSNDGQYILTAGRYDTEGKHDVVCWNAATGEEEWRIPTMENIESVCFAPDQKRIVAGGSDGIVRVYDIISGDELFATQEPHEGRVWVVAYTPDQTKIISAAFKDSTLRIWDANDGRSLQPIEASFGLNSAAVSPDGEHVVVTGGWRAQVFDLRTRALVHTLEGHESSTGGVDFSRDSQSVATASWDGTARIWDTQTGKQTHELKGHLDGIWSVRFHPTNDSLVATSSWDDTVKLWSLDDQPDPIVFQPGSEIATKPDWGVRPADFAPNGQWAVIGDNSVVRVIDLDTQLERFSLSTAASTVCVSPDGRWIVTGGYDGALQIWDSDAGTPLAGWTSDGRPISRMAVSRDNRTIVTGDDKGTVTMWDSRDRTKLISEQSHSSHIRAIAISSDNRRVLTSGGDAIVMWDKMTGETLYRHPLREYYNAAWGLDFSPDGTRIAVISGLRSVACLDVTTSPWKLTAHLQGDPGNISYISFYDNGRRILTASWSGAVRLWDAGTGRQIMALEDSGFLERARMSNDGRRIVALDMEGNIITWTAPTDEELAVWRKEDQKYAESTMYP